MKHSRLLLQLFLSIVLLTTVLACTKAQVTAQIDPPISLPEEMEELRQGCNSGNAIKCETLGNKFLYGYRTDTGIHRDRRKALEAYRLSCEGEHMPGCVNLGLMHDMGWETPEDHVAAAELFINACAQGYALGCSYHGVHYLNGKGVPKDKTKALNLFLQGCAGGDGYGCFEAGSLSDADQDYETAVKYYKLGCELEYSRGCTLLGLKYELGQGVQKNLEKALEHYKRGCRLRDSSGCSKSREVKDILEQ